MDAIQVNAILLRGLLPDLRLTPGTTLMARVLERHGTHGMLNLAGAIVVAELPENLEAGQRLRLAVQDASGERVVMRAIPDAQAAPAQQLPGQGAAAPTVG